jgi:hypothetical protein
MFRAKWITGKSLASPDHWWFNLTDLGLQRTGKVSDALIKVAPGFFKAVDTSVLTSDLIKQPSAVELFMMQVKIAPVIVELQPPPFSPEETDVLFEMFATFARKKGKGQIPPSRR